MVIGIFIGIGIVVRTTGGSDEPQADPGFVLLVDSDGAYLTDSDGAYLQEPA